MCGPGDHSGTAFFLLSSGLDAEPENFVTEGLVIKSTSGMGKILGNRLPNEVGLIEGLAFKDNGFEQPSPVLFQEFLKDRIGTGGPNIEHGNENPVGDGMPLAEFLCRIQK